MISTPTSSMPRANGGYRHVVLVVDVFSSYLSYVPIKSMSNPTRFVEAVVTMYQNNGHPIKLLNMDHQFNTIEVLAYLDSMHINYQFAPPHEHEYIGRIERNNRSTQDKLSCALAISSTKSEKLWLYALGDVINKLHVVPRQHLSWQTPYYKWFGTQYDFHKQPLLPFGCRVMAHVPTSNQSKLSDNSVLHYYIGTAFRTKEGIMLYNPKTKQLIIRRSYQTLHDNDQHIPDLIHQSTHILPTTITTPEPVSLSPTIVSDTTSKSKIIMQRFPDNHIILQQYNLRRK
jgi:hypothetical protein